MRVELKKYPDYRPTGIEYLDRVPKAWQLRPLKTVLKQKRGAIKAGPFGTQLLASEMLSQGPVKVLNQRNVIDADLIAGENYVSATKFADLKAFEVFPGDILLTSRGTIGRTCLVLSLNEPAILHPCLIRIQPDERLVGAKYLMMLLGGRDRSRSTANPQQRHDDRSYLHGDAQARRSPNSPIRRTMRHTNFPRPGDGKD